MKKVLVGTDTTASADLAVQTAAELARLAAAQLLVVHVRSNGASHDAADPKKAALRHAPCSVFIVDTRTAQ